MFGLLAGGRRMAALAIGATGLMMLGAGCAWQPTPTSELGAELTKIKVTNPSNMSNVPLYIGIKEGFFAEEGLEIEAGIDLGAGSTVEAVIGGQVDMAWVNTGGALTPFGEGIDINLVVLTDRGTPGNLQVVVKEDSPLKELADLQGKKLAVLSPSTTCVWLVKSALAAQGLDPESVTMSVVSPPEHAIVLDTGQVDATCTTDPTRTAMVQELGVRSIFDPAKEGVEAQRSYPVGGYVVSGKYAAEHKDELHAFQRALAKSASWANAHPDEVRATLTTLASVDSEVAAAVTLPDFVEEVGVAGLESEIQMVVDATYETGISETKIDQKGFLFN
ncbi:NitT/TauT family transport system substrate-binding protein [Arthrobacter sp. V4I6]|uniref:ABC transporter substrate-binding protein n=1 Tax=unclassified Arthrobacter TaxID=235627 RepID=UPI0027878B8E|nr:MULTISPECIES: ABC transporter substrate-binding protein [unclassified Arthrobacter]MDQ0821611.1 NitT/TauT family transport system substrate-binding protein [Arthrobacter sp. V1I7]MDQ0855876.1 NitT/TauT family transport system substrate-binding protein [Arthrobacter sp. V4I6]